MGGVVPKGESNNELIDNLIDAKYLSNEKVIKAFKQVDRGDFCPEEYKEDAYRDMAMRSGSLHLSAPCIYCSVLENLDLKEGVSFLNIGSGTGYLSTLAGQLLGFNDANHGIEVYQNAIDYAVKKVHYNLRFGNRFNVVSFCKPHFVCGNISCLDENFRQYNRVYVGARVADEHTKNHIQRLVSVGGILIFPYGENLVKYTKLSETSWDEKFLLNVQFADLIGRRPEDTEDVRIYSQPYSLKECAREAILKLVCFGKVMYAEHAELLDQLPIPNVLIKYLKYYRNGFVLEIPPEESAIIVTTSNDIDELETANDDTDD